MAPVCSTNRSDFGRVSVHREPVVNRSANPPALDGRISRAMVTGDQQDNTLMIHNGLIESAVDGRPGPIQAHAVEVESSIRLQAAAANLLVPAAIQSLVGNRNRLLARGWLNDRRRSNRSRFRGRRCELLSSRWSDFLSREWADRRRHAAPELRFFRAEGAHATHCPWGPGSAPRRSRTFRRQSPRPPGPHPRRYRSGSVL